MAYRNLDYIIPWYVDDFVDLNEKQEKQLQALITKHVNWHSKHQLPAYIDMIKKIESLPPEGPTHEDIKNSFIALQNKYRETVDAITPDFSMIMSSFSQNQIDNFSLALRERNREFQEEFVDPEDDEYYSQRAKKIKKSFRKWFRYVNKKQEQLIIQWSKSLNKTGKMRNAFHQNWQQMLLEQLSEPASSTNKSTHIKQTLELLAQGDADLQLLVTENIDISARYIVTLWKTLDRYQKHYLKKKLNTLRHDLNDLTAYRF